MKVFERLDKFIEENEEEIMITGGVNENVISKIKNELGLQLNHSIKNYLTTNNFQTRSSRT